MVAGQRRCTGNCRDKRFRRQRQQRSHHQPQAGISPATYPLQNSNKITECSGEHEHHREFLSASGIPAAVQGSAPVVIVGGGPTGLFLANLLGLAGVSTLVLEKRSERKIPSMAIGVMPPSLQRLECIGLASAVVQAGCAVRTTVVHDQHAVLGALSLAALPPPYAFVLSIPQGDLMHLLRERLSAWPSVRILEGAEAVGISQSPGGVRLQVATAGEGAAQEIHAAFVVACDGAKSRLRELLGIARAGRRYGVSFVMGDFPDPTNWAQEAHLFFTPQGSVESFPLPGNRRRWVALACGSRCDPAALVQRVQAIAGVRLSPDTELWHSSFTPERQLAQRYCCGRVALCGDAAHVMSPIGGQGMNTGFADAWMLAEILPRLLQTREEPAPLLARYDAARRRAFNVAANRAARGMWLGTRTGRVCSAIRSVLIGRLLLRPPMVRSLPRYFAMLNIPGNEAIRTAPAAAGSETREPSL